MACMPGRSILTTTILAGFQGGGVHLRDGGRGGRLDVETRKHAVERRPQGVLDGGDRHVAAERRDAILQLRQIVGDVRRNQIATRGQRLAELDEYRTQFLEREAQALAAGDARAALEPCPGR